jgi:hypothetical protein
MAGTFAAQATARGVRIDRLEVDVEGMIDLNGFFGIRPVEPGLSDVKVGFRVRSEADDALLKEILSATRSLSPIHDSVSRPIAVQAAIARE